MRISPRSRTVLFAAVTALVAVTFVARGPFRALTDQSRDLAVHYGAARVWLAGGNPYDMTAVQRAVIEGGAPRSAVPAAELLPSFYPPGSHVATTPLALLRWDHAVIFYQAFTLAALALALLSLARYAGLAGTERGVFVIACLALAPIHTGLAAGQMAIPGGALLIVAWTCMATRPALSGVLMAFAFALKPTIGLPFALAALAARPRLRWFVPAVGTGLGLFAAGVLRLSLAGGRPLHDWLAAVHGALSGVNRPAPDNPESLTLLGLPMLLHRFTDSATTVNGVSGAFVAILGVLALERITSSPGRKHLHALCLLCVVSLLGMYHRVYDAVLLVLPLAALVRDWRSTPRRLQLVSAAALSAFLLPGPVILHRLQVAGWVPPGLSGSAFWRLVLVPHQIWALVLYALALAYLIVRSRAGAVDPRSAGRGPQILTGT